KKNRALEGPVSVIADVGAGNIFQRGTCCRPVILGGYTRRNSEPQVCEACGSATTPIVACQPCASASRWESHDSTVLSQPKATTLIVELWQRVRSASAVHSQPGSRGIPGCGR